MSLEIGAARAYPRGESFGGDPHLGCGSAIHIICDLVHG